MAIVDRITPEPRCFSIRLPHWVWFLLATVLLAVGYVGLSVWLPGHREQQVIQMIESWGGHAKTSVPKWLPKLVGEDRIRNCMIFQRVAFVNLNQTEVSDSDIAYLGRLTKLERLDLGGTVVTDACLVHLSGLKNLESLWLISTEITEEGVKELKTALPNCDVPHSKTSRHSDFSARHRSM